MGCQSTDSIKSLKSYIFIAILFSLSSFSTKNVQKSPEELLETAIRLANLFLARIPEDSIPYWGFNAPQEPEEPKDASAAAIVAFGLWELATLMDQAELKSCYRAASKNLVEFLSSSKYLAIESGLPVLLLHSTANKPKNRDVNVPIIYAD